MTILNVCNSGSNVLRDEMKRVFRKSLKGTASVLRDQLKAAKNKGYAVQKVLLIGGFGQSPSLQNYLRRKVTDVELNSKNERIALLTPRTPSTVVARGAVLRAHSKEFGPERTTQCSYGFLRSEPYEPDSYEAHKVARPKIDRVDGERYIDSTIDWLIKKGDVLPTKKVVTIEVKHTFKLTARSFLCQEQLFVSDERRESHYRKTHHMNKGAELAGQITVDMRFLREQNLIQPERPSMFSKQKASHWAVRFDLVMIIDGRNLHYEARWPSSNDTEMSQHQKVLKEGQICIAAAFQSGTD